MKKRERRKNIVVGVLATCALGVMVWTLIGGGTGRRRSGPVNLVPDLPAPAPAALAAVQAAAPTVLEPEKPIDLVLVRNQYSAWVESPARDPFMLIVAPPQKSQGPRAADLLALRAIWRQSGGRLTVINNLVLGEGDRIAGFSIEKIDASQVWVRGTNGSEHLDLQVGTPPVARPDNSKPQPGRRPPPGGGTTLERRLSP